MKKKMIFIGLLFLSINAFSQHGDIELFLPYLNNCGCNEIKYALYSNEVKVREGVFVEGYLIEEDYINDTIREFEVYDGKLKLLSLKEGKYQIDMYRNDTLVLQRYDIYSTPNSLTSYTLDVEAGYVYSLDDFRNDAEAFLNFQYGSGKLENNPAITNQYSISMGINAFFMEIGNFNELAITSGLDYQYSAFSPDFTNYSSEPDRRERYSGIFASIGLLDRFQFYKSGYDDIAQGWVIDLGVNYNLPILFRHKYNVDNTITSTRKIVKYNNFSTIFRIGYAPYTLSFEYRLSDYIKNDFPQVPKYQVGLSLLIR